MVMEAPGSQNVGREFVRQYYTLLHEAPDQLHRFYSFNSSFVHGGVERPGEEQPPVTGQKEIHKKIMSLQFKNCHAKIRQVDCQSTVDNAIVIQVTGELSNNGEPMRRFMQTFVLAAQSETKYYVQNDIFRYQDEVFEEELSDVEDDVPVTQTDQYYASNGDHQVEEEDEPIQEPSKTPSVSTDSASEETATVPEEEVASEPEPVREPEPKKEDVVEPVQPAKPAAPLTWSARVKGSGPSTESAEKKPAAVPGVATGDKPPAQPQRQVRTRNRPAAATSSGDSPRVGASASARSAPSNGNDYPDSHQLFIGNVRHKSTDQELSDHFSSWGKVIEMRMNRKNREAPHFGFVVFDSADAVEAALNDQDSRHFQGAYRVNVERKIKPKDRGGPRSGDRGGATNRGGAYRGGRGGGAARGGRAAPAHRGGANGNFPARGSTPHQQRSN